MKHDTLEDMIREAESTGLMLFSPYQSLWFTTEELRAANANGKFRWGPVNWKLRSAEEHTIELENDIRVAEGRLEAWQIKLHGAPTTGDGIR